MILVTVGTQLPFDRLIEAVDRMAPNLNEDVIAQTGKGKYVCSNINACSEISPKEFERHLKSCSRIIAHAGIGTVLNAQKYRKPLVLVPRLAKFGEHRNDHQIATCKMLADRPGIHIVQDLNDLTVEFIEGVAKPFTTGLENERHQMLIGFLKNTIHEWDQA